MERLVIDESLPTKLLALRSPVELVDRDGHLIAVVHPRFDPALYDLGADDISEGELERRATSEPRIPAAEILPRLRKLA